MRDRVTKLVIIILLIILLTANFFKNIFLDTSIDFNNFSKGSEYLVISKLLSDKFKLSENARYGLLIVMKDDKRLKDNEIYSEINREDISSNDIQISEYKSQVRFTRIYIFILL